jgi:hypothetical protein
MKTISIRLIGCAYFVLATGVASASCVSTGTPTQSVWLSSGSNEIGHWDVNPTEIHRARLANGFNIDLKIEPATTETYNSLQKKLNAKALNEMVKIAVYDMGGAEPKLLTTTWGGANSKQGYGPDGGANRVDAIGAPGIELLLHKAACVKADNIIKQK